MRDTPRILVVDDEADLVELLSYNLRQAGYEAFAAYNGLEALQAATRHRPNLIVLDIMMPEMSGVEVARRLRADPKFARTPIIMLTARASEHDQVVGLSVGADDYVTKPFSPKVLLARIEAVLRRTTESGAPTLLTLGPIHMDLDTHEVTVDGKACALTPTEFRLLAALIQASGRVLTREQMIARGMGPGIAVTGRAIDVHIAAVRRKLGEHERLVQTVRGVGYRTVAPADDASALENV
jgi:two-component system phosphate regulon response regulator PhoB